MKESTQLSWKKGMAFEAEIDGYKIMVDATPENGGTGKGPRPKPLVMVALAGCTAMDVISILQKMRVDIEGLTIKTEGELTEEHPKHFTSIHLIYEFKGKNLPLDKLEKAITLSEERYCGVWATYRKAMGITFEIKTVE
jgi:putative redox protein